MSYKKVHIQTDKAAPRDFYSEVYIHDSNRIEILPHPSQSPADLFLSSESQMEVFHPDSFSRTIHLQLPFHLPSPDSTPSISLRPDLPTHPSVSCFRQPEPLLHPVELFRLHQWFSDVPLLIPGSLSCHRPHSEPSHLPIHLPHILLHPDNHFPLQSQPHLLLLQAACNEMHFHRNNRSLPHQKDIP